MLYKKDPLDATREALDIIENIETPGKYMYLLQALNDSGTKYTWKREGFFAIRKN